MTTKLVYPSPITDERVSFLIKNKHIDKKIASINLEMVKMKLKDEDEGLSWSNEQCESAEIEYKRYLNLCKENGQGIVPNQIMDFMWHYHILDTRAYSEDCNNIFGGYLHHYPYFGMRGEGDAENLKNTFFKTKSLYKEFFREDMARPEHNDCWHDCENRCWHACPSVGDEND